MTATLPAPVREALEEAGGATFLSPHLDDAVLSCGALMSGLAGRVPLRVVTVFTEAGAPPHTLATRSFLRQCGAGDAGGLYAERRAEDAAVLGALGAQAVHLGGVDALFRRRHSRIAAVLGRVLPEIDHCYPTYRYDIARGRVSGGDRGTVADLGAVLRRVLDGPGSGAGVVFAPLGIGRHVDHLLTRSLATGWTGAVVYYGDFPYCLRSEPEQEFLRRHGLTGWEWPDRLGEKIELAAGYRTQMPALFGPGPVPVVPEQFYSAL